MAGMTLKAVHGDGERHRLPLSERIVDENLSSYRHIPSRTRGSDQPQRTPKPASRDQPTLLSRAGTWQKRAPYGARERHLAAAFEKSEAHPQLRPLATRRARPFAGFRLAPGGRSSITCAGSDLHIGC